MSQKRENRKMMNMLERMGMVQKVEEPPEEPSVMSAPAEAPEEAAPVFEQTHTAVADIPRETVIPAAPTYPSVSREPARPEPSVYDRITPPVPAAPVYPSYEPPEPAAASHSFWESDPQVAPDTDRFLETEELYRSFGLKTNGTDTIYLIEEYMKTLPDSLPAESRRSIILRLVAASGFDFDQLLNDGIDRVAKLNEYAAGFSAHTDEIVARNNAEIDALQRQISRIQDIIGDRRNLHKRQFLSIESEAQRLKQILDFITK